MWWLIGAIVDKMGESWYSIKVDGTKGAPRCENVSVVVRLLLISTANAEDSKTDQFDK